MSKDRVGECRDVVEGVAMQGMTLIKAWFGRRTLGTEEEVDPLTLPLASAEPTEDESKDIRVKDTKVQEARARFIPCNHCAKFSGCRPRGLCNRCYYSPEIRARYRKDEDWIERRKREAKEEQARTQDRVIACHTYAVSPTPYQPGTEGKLRVMIERAHLNLPLFNPLDGRKNIA